jgi:hypothetical protein
VTSLDHALIGPTFLISAALAIAGSALLLSRRGSLVQSSPVASG